MLYDREKCAICGMCAKLCPQKAIANVNNFMVTDLEKCIFCGECVTYCIPGARQVAGKEYTVEEVLAEVLKDRVFYEESSGGVTLSGGEPLVHIDFVEELLIRLKAEGIHTAVDTCGAIPFEHLERAVQHTDLFLYDLKLTDDAKHKEFTGASNKEIIENLENLARIHANIQMRMPIIEGVNAEVSHIESTIALLEAIDIKEVHLLPYHAIAKHKYAKLGRDYLDDKMQIPSKEKLEHFREMLAEQGYDVKGG